MITIYKFLIHSGTFRFQQLIITNWNHTLNHCLQSYWSKLSFKIFHKSFITLLGSKKQKNANDEKLIPIFLDLHFFSQSNLRGSKEKVTLKICGDIMKILFHITYETFKSCEQIDAVLIIKIVRFHIWR